MWSQTWRRSRRNSNGEQQHCSGLLVLASVKLETGTRRKQGQGKVNSREAAEHPSKDFAQSLSTNTAGTVVRVFQAFISLCSSQACLQQWKLGGNRVSPICEPEPLTAAFRSWWCWGLPCLWQRSEPDWAPLRATTKTVYLASHLLSSQTWQGCIGWCGMKSWSQPCLQSTWTKQHSPFLSENEWGLFWTHVGFILIMQTDSVSYGEILPIFTWTGTVNWGQAVALRKKKELCAGDSFLITYTSFSVVPAWDHLSLPNAQWKAEEVEMWVLPEWQRRCLGL